MDHELLAHQRSLTEEETYKKLYTDSLTQAFNRDAFYLKLPTNPVIAVIDLDSLKYINDNISHEMGNTYLCRLANFLKNHFHAVYRLGGDEFAVVAQDSDLNLLEARLYNLQTYVTFFSFGAGFTLEQADKKLREDKVARVLSKKRAARGERPPYRGA